ncbi:MAG: tetratricopeptide repeat protein [Woeseia sp.]
MARTLITENPWTRVACIGLLCLASQGLEAEESRSAVDLSCFVEPEWATEPPGVNRAFLLAPFSYGAEEMLKALDQLDEPMEILKAFTQADCDYRQGIGAFVLGYIWDLKSVQRDANGFWVGNSDKELVEAYAFYKISAESGNTYGQSNVCHRLLDGVGVPKNYVQARYHCEAAASKGDKLAYLGLGRIFLHGKGVEKNPLQAYVWYLLADGSGHDLWQISVDSQIKKLERVLSIDEINRAQSDAFRSFNDQILKP